MRTIEFRNGAAGKHREALTLIAKAPEGVREKMELSYLRAWNQLVTMLHNLELRKDDFGFEVENATLEISPDFVPGSFAFAFRRGQKMYDLTGGMILHGAGTETFSVEPENEGLIPHWSIHT